MFYYGSPRLKPWDSHKAQINNCFNGLLKRNQVVCGTQTTARAYNYGVWSRANQSVPLRRCGTFLAVVCVPQTTLGINQNVAHGFNRGKATRHK